jgi:hypothetical protein
VAAHIQAEGKMITHKKLSNAEAAIFFEALPVKIKTVSFPELEHHAKYIGQIGVVERVVKSRGVIVVKTAIGKRDCFPENLEIVAC